MPIQLLPASAAAFAPRAPPNIVLGSDKIDHWLTQSIKRCLKVKRVLHNPKQHERALNELLSGENAIWTLASLLLPKAPETELLRHEDALIEAMAHYYMVHIQAYIVHVDMVFQNEVAFKLTQDSIDALIQYHRDVYSVDAANSLFDWPEKDAQVKKMQDNFVQATNRFVYRSNISVLEGLEDEGAGELLDGRADLVKEAIMNLFSPLSPPPPRIVDVVIPAPAFATYQASDVWWQQPGYLASHAMPGDPWQTVLPSTPGPSMAHCSASRSHWWPSVSVESTADPTQHQSPTPSLIQNDHCSRASTVHSSPEPVSQPSELPCPSHSTPYCGSTMEFADFGLTEWDLSSWTPQYAAVM